MNITKTESVKLENGSVSPQSRFTCNILRCLPQECDDAATGNSLPRT